MAQQVEPLDNHVIESLASGTFTDPFSVLGMHSTASGKKKMIRVFLPGAEAVEAVEGNAAEEGKAGSTLCELKRVHERGVFQGIVSSSHMSRYCLLVHYPQASVFMDDPYRFGSTIRPEELYLFHNGEHEKAYQFLGANPLVVDDVAGIRFVVWAPNARRVAVVADFNNWDARVHGMRLHFDSGIWELFIPGVKPGANYKFAINSADGTLLPLKSDPFTRLMELRPGTASRVADSTPFDWNDEQWINTRSNKQHVDAGITIYEIHAGSWRRGNSGEWLNYRKLAQELIPYVIEMGFSHIQLMPLNEFPFDGSWGYQPVGMFAPSVRFGDANDFRYLIDLAHQNGIGVLLDWVPGHFPTDEHGLGKFDGTHLFEHSDPRQGFHPDWKTYIFNYHRPEVKSYLLSNALYWLEEFHIDGLRIDAVASMLYLDYSRNEGEWLPNQHGGRENLGAIDLLRMINSRAYRNHPGIMMIAEESTAWPGVTQFADSGGLGFGFKWNMGWMNDTLSYMSRDSIHRQYHHNEMTFSLLYAFSENFILPLSHDEVVHGKKALLEKMPGDDWQKFANLRAYLGFMWGHPGKKLLFMGDEFAQRREWDHDQSLDWHLLQHANHSGMQKLVSDLNKFYHGNPALWSLDNSPDGFEWITAGEHSGAIFIFVRRGRNPDDQVIVASNLTPTQYPGFRFGVAIPGDYEECLNTNSRHYGGNDLGNQTTMRTEDTRSHGRPYSLSLVLPPLSTIILKKSRD